MKIRCQCGAIYNVPESTCGKKVSCKKCDATFTCPTPPPKVNFNPSGQPVAGTALHSPYARNRQASRPAPQQQLREEAVLKKYMSEEKSLEERISDRRRSSIERDRTSNSISYIIVGLIWIAAAVAITFILWSLTGRPLRGRQLIIVWGLAALGARYWLGPILVLIGIYKIVIGIMSLTRVVDIESEEQLPTNF